MEKFLLLIREDIEKLRLSQQEHSTRIREMTKWVETLGESGNYIGGEPLVTIGRYVSKDNVLSDGPFIEAKESISGYIFIKAENLDQAVSMAQTCPYVMNDTMVIEVRPVMAMENSTING
jgi:hypothetical protein